MDIRLNCRQYRHTYEAKVEEKRKNTTCTQLSHHLNRMPERIDSSDLSALCDRVTGLLRDKKRQLAPNSPVRVLIAVAGVPGAGKSTITARLIPPLKAWNIIAAVLAQDGFDYDGEVLRQMPSPEEAIERRGARFTFDARAFVKMVADVQRMAGVNSVWGPTFDHALKDPTPDGVEIAPEVQVVFVEGNYVLLKDTVWSRIGELTDESWFVLGDSAEIVERIVKRHLAAGIASTEAEARDRAMGSDQLNALYVVEHSRTPEIEIVN